MRRILLAALTFAFLSAPVLAQEEAAGLDALFTRAQRGSIDASRKLAGMLAGGQFRDIEARATAGDAVSQYTMGRIDELAAATDAKTQLASARQWYEKAGAQRHPFAEYKAGQFFAYGWGGAKDADTALRWFARAGEDLKKPADEGDTEAQCAVAYLETHGYGVTRDEADAAKRYKEAARSGSAEAALALVNFYADHKGTKKDDAIAVEWLRATAAQDDPRAKMQLGLHYLLGDLGLKANMEEGAYWLTLAQVQAAQDNTRLTLDPAILRGAKQRLTASQQQNVDTRVGKWVNDHPTP